MSKVYADIIVDISQEKLDKSFQYEIPENFRYTEAFTGENQACFGGCHTGD